MKKCVMALGLFFVLFAALLYPCNSKWFMYGDAPECEARETTHESRPPAHKKALTLLRTHIRRKARKNRLRRAQSSPIFQRFNSAEVTDL
jgi:hypothetical protein